MKVVSAKNGGLQVKSALFVFLGIAYTV